MHNVGCFHDVATCGGRQHPYGHGLQVPNRFRTVMAYQCNGCMSLPFLSAVGYSFQGIPVGDPTTNNARLVQENAAAVSARSGGCAECIAGMYCITLESIAR